MNRRHFLATIGTYAIIPPVVAFGQEKEKQETPPEPPGTPIRRVLPSGLRLIVVERPDASLTALTVAVRVGSGDEEPNRAGLLHLIEHLVFKGTESKQPGDFDRVAEGLGGEIGARTLRDATLFELTVPVGGWKQALGTLADLTLHPAFRPEDLEAEKKVVRSEMALDQLDPFRAGLALIGPVLYAPGEPYASPLFGEASKVSGYTPDDLRAVHLPCYRPARMTVCVVGPVGAREVWAEAARLFEGPKTPPVARPLRLAALPPQRRPEKGLRAPTDPYAAHRTLSSVVMAWPTPPAADVVSVAGLMVLAELLARGESGRLAAPLIVQQEAALRVGVELVPQRCGGLFVLHATTAPAKAASLEQAILDQLRRVLEDGFSDAEVAAARGAAQGKIVTERASVEGLARRLSFHDALDAPGLEEEIEKRLPDVRPEGLQNLLRTLLHPSNRATALLGPTGGAA